MTQPLLSTAKEEERALLAAHISCAEDYITFAELEGLAKTAGATVVNKITQKSAINPGTLFGSGKIEEMKQIIETENINLLITDNSLSGSQNRNLSEALGVKVVDRSALILDIFAMRATSLEGKLQVELAQLKYNLPRLIGSSGKLAKLNAGIGMRGPGEKKLETDKRFIRKEIDDLKKRIEKLKEERSLRRSKRTDNAIKTAALVGYTNVGKSSLLNALSKSDVLAENKLFATLDPITRKVFSTKGEYLLTDTVGFINKLPTEFISAFSSTLEEAKLADLLIIVLDLSDPNLTLSYEVVTKTLESLEILNKKILYVYNKSDMALSEVIKPTSINSIEISVKTGHNIDKLKEEIENILFTQ